MIKSVYALCYEDPNRGPVIFYIGCTNDPARRLREHQRNAFDLDHTESDTYKYQFIRDLKDLGLDFTMEIVEETAITDEADEYTYVLRAARLNESLDIKFYDSMPLTNMRAGDFLEEMLRDRSVVSAESIRSFRARQEQKKKINYERNNGQTDLARNRSVRERVRNQMVVITNTKRAEDVIQDLEKRKREQRKEEELRRVRKEQTEQWLRTGKILGDEE